MSPLLKSKLQHGVHVMCTKALDEKLALFYTSSIGGSKWPALASRLCVDSRQYWARYDVHRHHDIVQVILLRLLSGQHGFL